MFGESESFSSDPNIISYEEFFPALEKAAYEVFQEMCDINEGSYSGSVDNPKSPTYKALKKKSDKSGFPLGILKQVFKRGKAAWARSGHVPGTVPNQWAMARVNSLITGGKTTKMHDKALYKRAKANLKKKK
jgi:hypothetical protein